MATWGPDGTLGLDEGQAYEFKVPARCRATLQFSADAWWENVCIIYPSRPRLPQKYCERGNHFRSLANWVAPVREEDTYYVITGWHKDSPPRAGIAWHQSKIMVHEESTSEAFHEVSFEDVHSSEGYDDLRVTVTIRPT